ncbi:MAG: TRAP transporter large permease [Atribacterota bacterium]|nr:TRAP transporter large permease [Atribacterota bacterium]MDD4896256.1 TRAP transporter large permease [Atribacterota bacterium]MDD5636850.1 TRAP transporter large permease [Atribacterota bacterium]
MISLVLITTFFVLLVLGIPVSFALGISSVLAIFLAGLPLIIVFQRMFSGVNSFVLTCIPFFILMGNIMEKGGIARRIVNFSNIIIGRVRGGLSAVNILASMFFAGISGSAVADTSSIGSILIPMMNEEGYDRNFSAAVTCTSSTIGLIIPPSNSMILYSFVAGGISVAKLFAAGIVPGIIIGIALMVVSYIISIKRKYPSHPTPSFQEAIQITKETLLSLFLVIVIVVGILGGIFTATEASVFGAMYAFIISFFVYKEIKIRDMPEIILKTVYTTAVVMFLIATSTAFAYILALEQIPKLVADLLLSITNNKYIILFIINIVLLIVGTFMDMSPAILIFTPIFLPIVTNLGLSPIHFGIIMLVNLCIGLCTPPVGTVLFVGLGIADIKMNDIIKPLLLFLIPMFLMLMLVTYFEPITMFVPNLLFK